MTIMACYKKYNLLKYFNQNSFPNLETFFMIDPSNLKAGLYVVINISLLKYYQQR